MIALEGAAKRFVAFAMPGGLDRFPEDVADHALLIIRTWRYIHITLACLALLVIIFHAVMETLTNILHVLHP